MRPLEKEFQTDANKSGLQTFRQVKQGTRTVTNRRNGESRQQNVYIYQRIDKEGNTFGYEVVTPNVKEAGTYPLPGGKTITYDEAFEEYPGASVFGRLGWFCGSLDHALERFNNLVAVAQETNEKEENNENDSISIPNGEFSVGDYAQQLGVAYVEVANWLRGQLESGAVKLIRKERRCKLGRATNIFAKA